MLTALLIGSVFLGAGSLLTRSSYAQGTVYVQIDGIPPVLESPLLSEFERKYRQGSFRIQFVFISPTRQPRPFQFKLTLEHDGEQLIEMDSEPISFEPGVYSYATFDDDPAIIFPLSYDEWLGLLNPELANTGILSEGDYLLKIEAIPTDPNTLIPSVPGVALFTVRYAEPPLLLTPPNEASISAQLPIFSWTPVTGAPLGSTMEYELLITEVLPEQAPAQALESNIEQAHRALIEQTSFVYSPNELPLEPGKVYAWQVQARDVNDQLPILDRGATEIYTFSILGEGLGTGLTAWSFPISSPFLRYDFENNQEIDASDPELFFDDYLPIDLLGLQTNAAFESVLIDVETQRIIEGSILIDDAFSLEIAINPLNDSFSGYKAVSSGSDLTLDDGVLLDLGSDILIDSRGLQPKGSHLAQVSYSGYGQEQWTATYSEDLVLDFSPFTITSGRIDFAADGVAKGYADPSGFYLLSQSDPVIAQLPDRLLIDGGELGYISLKNGPNALVNPEEKGQTFEITGNRIGVLELIIPSLQNNYQSQPPRFSAQLENVIIDAATGEFIEGSIVASRVDSSSAYTLDAIGIPIAPNEFRIERSDETTQVQIEGIATLFGQPINNIPSITLDWDTDHVVRGTISQDSLEGYIWLSPENKDTQLSITSLEGIIHAPLKAPISSFQLDIEGQLELLANSELAASAKLSASFDGNGYATVNYFEPTPLVSSEAYVFNEHALFIDEISSFDIYYSVQRGIEYRAGLQAHIESQLMEGGSLIVPLQDTEFTELGISFPNQEIHEGTPQFQPTLFNQGDNQLELAAIRLPATQLSTKNTEEANTNLFSPVYDFELLLRADEHRSISLSSIPFTVQGATLQNGLISGPILPYTFVEPLEWTFDAGVFEIHSLSGALVAQEGKESQNLFYSGAMHLVGAPESSTCEAPAFYLTQKERSLDGYSTSFTPCQPFTSGRFSVELGESTLRVQTTDAASSFLIEGALLNIATDGSNTIESPGEITLDLSSNTVVSAEAEISSIDVPVPYNEPLYSITLEDVVLTEEGFSIQSENQITAEDLADEETHSVKIDDEFTLGWLPEISNVGKIELIKSDAEDEVVTGYLDSAGFHPLTNSNDGELPERIALPDGVEAYLVFADDEDSAIKAGKKTREGIELSSNSEENVFLAIPFFGAQDDPVLFPVTIDLLLNDAFAFTSGEIAGNYESAPIDLEDVGYPLRIRSIQFDSNQPQGHRLQFEGELRNPVKEEDDDAETYFPFDAKLSQNGFSGTLTSSSTTTVYPDILDLRVREISISNSRASGKTVRFNGELISPFFNSSDRQTYIGIEGSFEASSSNWRYELASYQPGILPIGTTQLHVDSKSGYALNSDSELDLTIAGTFKYAGMLDPNFTLGAILDIGRNGIVLWPNDDLWTQQPLFGGILSTSIDAFDITYDSENNRVVTTIDGAFIPQLSSENSNDNVIPFSGIQLSSEGALSISGDQLDLESAPSETEALDLLANLSPIKLINDAFLIESIRLVNDSSGLKLDLSGRVTLPNYRSFAPGRNLSDLNPSLPVSMTIGHDGAIERNETFWIGQELAGLLPQSTGSNKGINYSAVDLDFDPRLPDQAQILASAKLSVENFVTASTAGEDSDTSIQPQHSELEDQVSLSLGSHSDPKSHPGIRIQEQSTINYLLTDYPTAERPLFKLRGDLTDVYATKIALYDSAEPIFTVSGRSMLTIDGFSGYFPIKDMTIDPRGVTDLGSLSAPSALAFQNIASFELNCFENQQNSVSSLRHRRGNTQKPSSRSVTSPADGPFDAQIRFGTFCGSSLPLTLTDRWFAGTFDEFNISNDAFSSTSLQINGVDVPFSDIASFQGTFTFDDTSAQSYFQVDGETLYQGVELTSTGSLKSRNGLPSLSILFSPARQPLEIIPNYGYARIPGGGIFLRPTESEIGLVSLALDERSNNSFSSNYPGTTNNSELNIGDQLSLVTPVEFALESGHASLDFNGIGILRETEQFTYLDLDGAFYDDNEKLKTDLFLVQREGLNTGNSSPLFEGLSNISLNYSTVVGGVIPANISLSYSPDSTPTWSANGYSQFILTDTIKLPGHFVMNPSGFALSLQDEIDVDKGHFSVDDEISVLLWQLREQEEIQGYTSFTSSIDLLPGYMLNEDRMYGALIKDRDEYQFYAARNQYADVPFIFNGPIDPWLAFQDGGTFGGDARNSVFLRMLQDARASSQKISGLTEQATTSLQNALDLQRTISEAPIASKEFSLFSKSPSALSEFGQRIEQVGSSFIGPESYPSALQSIQSDLYNDENRPELNYAREQVYASGEASEALTKMRSSIEQARKSADLDIYSFQTISPRPLLWLADNVDLAPELEDSPFTIQEDKEALNVSDSSFQIDLGIASAQTRSLIAFKQNNESIDSQFIRAIGGLENNLVNLKTVRTPEQAFDFEIANSSIRQFYAQQISDDWTMLDWSKEKADWLTERESTIEEGIRAQFAQLSSLEDAQDKLKTVAVDQYNLALEIGENTSWQREDLPEGTSYTEYVNGLSEQEVEAEFVQSAKNMWFDAPLASLNALSDSLTSLLSERVDQFRIHSDSLNNVSDNFSKALDPLYDVQTQYTTTLFGMADEYRIWRSSIRGLDPEAVDYSFQFTPYRGNYRILAEDLTPPIINDIVVSPSSEGYLSHTSIEWETDHPVELAEISLAVSEDTSSATYFTSLATSSSTSYFTTKSDSEKTEKDISLTLRVRGAGGVPVIKQGQFSVDVSPTESESAQQEITLVPVDSSPPPSPTISDLEYSSYFGETPNILQFKVEALRDTDSGIERVEYKIESEDGKNLIQDWTSLPFSTTYFGGRIVETSLPVQEDEITVKVSVRITNGSGLTSIADEELELDLDVSPPTSSVQTLLYYDEFENTNPNSLAVAVIDIADQESGIDKVEYTITKEAQANLANAIWDEFLLLPNRPQRTGSQTVYLPLADQFITEASNNLSIFIRATNGAGLQNVIRETIQIPGKDTSSPTEPSVTLEHTGFYSVEQPNQLRIIVGNSSDFESGIGRVLYRVLDGQNGQVIYDWDDFLIISPGFPTYIIPTTDKHIALPSFDTSRSIIVEVQSYNRAGLASTKAIRFLQTELDLTPPTEPQVSATYYSAKSPIYPNSILLDVGRIEDKEAPIVSVEYRIINIESPQRNQEWTPLDLGNPSSHTFPGFSSVITATSLAANTNHIIQVRSTNLQGLSNTVDVELEMDADDTPPVTPALLLHYSEEPDLGRGNLELTIGESLDPESFISRVRYRISDLQQVDSLLLNWQEVTLDQTSNQFDGISVQHDIPLLRSTSRYLVDAEVINGIGLSSRSSAIIDHNLIDTEHILEESNAIIDLFYFDSSNEIRSDELEVTVSLNDNFLYDLDSLQYRIDYTNDETTASEIEDSPSSVAWTTVRRPRSNKAGQYRFYAPIEALGESFSATAHVKLFTKGTSIVDSEHSIVVSNTKDLTPPSIPGIDIINYGVHHPLRANQIDLVINTIEDTQSRISEVSYRLINKENGSEPLVDWTPISYDTSAGLFSPKVVSIDLPEFSESALLAVEVRSTNGSDLTSVSEIPVSVIVDTTPPVFEEADIFVERSNSQPALNRLFIHLFGVSDQESQISEIDYRVSIEQDSSELFIDWTPIEVPTIQHVSFPEIRHDLPESENGYSVLVELKATNTAGLTTDYSETIKLDNDTSPPQIQDIEATYKLTKSGSGYVLIEPGSFRDPESQITHIEYRIVDASEEVVYQEWKAIPLQKDIRVQVNPITIPRLLLPFDATREVAIEFRAFNGFDLTETRRTTLEIPGDTTPPEASSLSVRHRNGYDPRHPNTIEIQVGPSRDDQSSIKEAQYRIINLATSEELLSWTSLPVSNDGIFPGKVIFADLPFLSSAVDMRVEVEISNSADLVRSVSENVTIQVAGDLTPPSVEIQSHYFSNAIAIVLDELSDPHSRIQKVEYRLVDNVDQSVLADWVDLFEIASPQERYSRQSYRVRPPEVQAGRAVKIEVRATNGAGLQSTVSKTILYQEPDSN